MRQVQELQGDGVMHSAKGHTTSGLDEGRHSQRHAAALAYFADAPKKGSRVSTNLQGDERADRQRLQALFALVSI